MNSIEQHISKDGSSTLYSKQFEQFYHNPNGAISESKHVFFEQSGILKFLKRTNNSISIFEMGFGTGLNLLLLMEYLNKFDVKIPIHFFSVEAYPAAPEWIKNINYPNYLDITITSNQWASCFAKLNEGWNTISLPAYPELHLSVFKGFFKDMPAPKESIDYFFHDPFSPEVNSELWTVTTFQKLKQFATPDAVLSTYCAASKARAAMAKAGWLVAKANGALGKREMTVASLNENKLIHLRRVNEPRLIQKFDHSDFSEN